VLQPSPLPRGYGQGMMGPGPLQGDFHSPMQPQQSQYQSVPPPIGQPPSRGSPAPLSQLMSPNSIPNGTTPNFSPGPTIPSQTGHSRRSSLDPGPVVRSATTPQYGAITRPIAPIGTRPSGGSVAGPSTASSSIAPGGPVSSSASLKADGDDGSLKGSGDLTGSPERLGSSALVDPEDEALPSAGGRRVGIVGSVWGPPGSEIGKPSDGRTFGASSWSAYNSPAPQPPPQLSSPLASGPWGVNTSTASCSTWPSTIGQANRGPVGFGGLPPPNLTTGHIGAPAIVGSGAAGTPFLQGGYGFPPGPFGTSSTPPGNSPSTQ